MNGTEFEALPTLSVGHHERGSGQACIGDAISYLEGSEEVTDTPSCVDRVLMRMAQRLNDCICKHSESDSMCSGCSHTMWMIGARLVGTAEAARGFDQGYLASGMATAAAVSVAHLAQGYESLRGVTSRAIRVAEFYAKPPEAPEVPWTGFDLEDYKEGAEVFAEIQDYWSIHHVVKATESAEASSEPQAAPAYAATAAKYAAAASLNNFWRRPTLSRAHVLSAVGAATAASRAGGLHTETPFLEALSWFEAATSCRSSRVFGPGDFGVVARGAAIPYAG